MSIYDGQCDRGSMVNDRCLNPAIGFRGESTYCHSDGGGQMELLGDRTWPDIAIAYQRQQRRIEEIIIAAEKGGDFLSRDGELYTPKEIRQIIQNGYTIRSLTIESVIRFRGPHLMRKEVNRCMNWPRGCGRRMLI